MDSTSATKLQLHKKKSWFLLLTFSLLLSTLLIIISLTSTSSISSFLIHAHTRRPKTPLPLFVESKLHAAPTSSNPVPKLAYLISGSAGEGVSLMRTLKALYHPRNQYAVHLDLEASAEERLQVAEFVKSEPLFRKVGNVRMVIRANLVTYRGPTMVTNTLHAAAILFKEGGQWDWFINLSASDYPLVTQDDLLHTLSAIPRDVNFIEHTSDIGWKEYQRAKPVIIDPGLYSRKKLDVFWASEKRSVPTAYRLFTGSAWMMLSRPFIEYCLWGWDNLPREFRSTTVNHDLHFISWDNPPKQHPHFLTLNDYQQMVDSNAPFARKFGKNEPVLDKIDSELLGCNADGFVPGGWFNKEGNSNITLVQTNTTELRPGPGAERLKHLVNGLLSSKDFHAKQCS
ncbi:Slow growth 1-like protein [Hibiscus syriacus]|uniref:Slow growth 1-like protein n=1 Tax=Hibiscus syriacus TaxID=106335 RepID=A0A6A2Z8X8_HIBSY|nr:Slow growth 1-like protein [Hibiscus syriacus]